jgi:transposase-like protein
MPELDTRPEPWLIPIRRPGCPKCERRMMLVGIAPGPERLELRTFECRKCDQSFTTTATRTQ